jgi:hypothetical protein
MRHLTLLIAFAAMLLAACKKSRFGELKTSSVTVTAKYPATYGQTGASGANITLTSVNDGSVKAATTNSNGDAVFADVLPGSYTIAASKNMSAAEALVITGISAAVTLNGTQNTAVVVSGQNPAFVVQLQGGAVGGLVIKEVYYTGSRTPANGTYFSDQFVEIYNNSTDTLYLDSLCIGDAFGNSGLINPTSQPTPFANDPQHVYLSNIWQVPGTGRQHPLAPGKSIVIAQDGVNHKDALLNPASPVDLSAADWETYNQRPDNRDADAPGVANLRRVYFTGGFDWLLTVFGPGVVIFKGDSAQLVAQTAAIPGLPSAQPRIKVAVSQVIDGFEALKDGSSASFKRIVPGIDAGFVFADDTYNKQSFRRKTSTIINGRRVLQDNNNSTADFEKLASPTPRAFN